ncbi:CPBP family intramembrane metalloprotease [bacterium]|nr:CPBP family intramembrane metalloprotease [bacterium]
MKPLGFGKSILFFAIPTLMMQGMYHVVMRVTDYLGYRLFFTFLIGFGVPSLLLLLAALILYRGEHSGLSFRERFRLQKLDTTGWIWTAILCAIWIAVPILMRPVTVWLQSHWFHPDKLWIRMMTPDPNYFMEVPLGTGVYAALIVFVIVNVFGGELFWRGYVFPRQELAFGSRTWLIHAVLWIIFRSFLPWELATFTVLGFALAYAVQRTHNTWTSILAHFCGLITMMLLR